MTSNYYDENDITYEYNFEYKYSITLFCFDYFDSQVFLKSSRADTGLFIIFNESLYN